MRRIRGLRVRSRLPRGMVRELLAVDDFLRVDRHEQMQDRAVARQRAQRVAPLLERAEARHRRVERLLRRQHFDGVERRRVGDDGFPRLHDFPVLELDARRAAALDHDLGHVRVERNVHAELRAAAVDRACDVLRAADGHAVRAPRLEEALEDVEHVRRHRALRREAAEDAHRVDEVPQERLRDQDVDGLVERVERQRQIREDVGVREHER
mmetsp:Transcript_22853/g.68506  ORF Transcript_22853/g.68506 Transcript_22853/m.68506 type:complete len:211 (-) Transcript_22853:906-1538(-)